MAQLTIQYQNGVFLPNLALWLDPHRAKKGEERVFVSHAHSDHTALHREVILSEPTSQLMRIRIGGRRTEHVMAFGETRAFARASHTYRLTLLPAGHILGSAMAWVETAGQTLLYTGDFKLRPGLSAELCEPRRADILIMETTFGRPNYVFPPSAQVLQEMIRFCQETLAQREIPVLLGYSLGKSQEIICGLAAAGLPLMLHGEVRKMAKVYERLGWNLPVCAPYDPTQAAGHVVICPPQAARTALRERLGAVRVGIATGWAVDARCRFRYGADAAFPLSDHADFPDLVEMVRRVAPKKVYTLHGFAVDFARTLRKLGFDAQALDEDEQLLMEVG